MIGHLENLLILPGEGKLGALQFLLWLVSVIHLPYVWLVIGGSVFSLLFNKNKNISNVLLDKVFMNKSIPVIFGVVPPLTIVLIQSQYLYGMHTMTIYYLCLSLILSCLSLLLLYRYSRLLKTSNNIFVMAAGAGGILVYLLSYLFFISGNALLLDADRWFTLTSAYQVMFSWNVAASYLEFISNSILWTGTALIIINYLRDNPDDILSNTGAGCAITGLLIYPVLQLFTLFTLPEISITGSSFVLQVIVLIFALCLFNFIILFIFRKKRNYIPVMGILLIIILLSSEGQRITAAHNSLKERLSLLVYQSNELKAKSESVFKRGETIYHQKCSVCHRFDEKLVGPPFNRVIPKYRGDKKALTGFINKPVKKNPDYPRMPVPGLSGDDINAVAEYLLKKTE